MPKIFCQRYANAFKASIIQGMFCEQYAKILVVTLSYAKVFLLAHTGHILGSSTWNVSQPTKAPFHSQPCSVCMSISLLSTKKNIQKSIFVKDIKYVTDVFSIGPKA